MKEYIYLYYDKELKQKNDNIQENEIIKLINEYKYISNNIQTLEE